MVLIGFDPIAIEPALLGVLLLGSGGQNRFSLSLYSDGRGEVSLAVVCHLVLLWIVGTHRCLFYLTPEQLLGRNVPSEAARRKALPSQSRNGFSPSTTTCMPWASARRQTSARSSAGDPR